MQGAKPDRNDSGGFPARGFIVAIAIALAVGLASVAAAAGEAAGGAAARAEVFRQIAKKLGAGQQIDPALFGAFVAAQNHDVTTGPAVGQKVPDFSLPDENGRRWTLHGLMGPHGLLLVFLRSADW